MQSAADLERLEVDNFNRVNGGVYGFGVVLAILHAIHTPDHYHFAILIGVFHSI